MTTMMTMTTTGEPGPVAFIGDSLIEWGQWGTAFPDADIVNFGQCGDTAAGVLARAGQALAWGGPRADLETVDQAPRRSGSCRHC